MKIRFSTSFSAYLLIFLLTCLSLSLHASPTQATCPFQSFEYEQLLCQKLFSDIPEEQNTLEGLTNSTGTITVENYKNVICSQKISSKNGGVLDATSVVVQNIQNDIKFILNITAQKGGVIHTTGNCSITQNLGKQYYIGNQSNAPAYASTSTNYGGAICCGGNLELSKNRGAICFAYNTAIMRGGAVSSDASFKITGNSAPILLMNNLALNQQGGAIYCQNCEISNNSEPIYITSNSSSIGGACHATSTVEIRNNSNLIFFANNSGVCDRPIGAVSSGGAISATTIKIEDNSGPVCFNNNTVDRNGGALWCQTLTIKNNGPVQFIKNRARWGGALLIKNDGTCDLSADNGDIIFNNNCGTYSQLYRNTMHCTAGTTLKVGAKKNYCVKFYDPIQCHYPSPLITFNNEDYHEGTVLLSGIFVPDSFKDEANFISNIKNPITIKYGVLAIEDRAGLAVYKITQENSTVRLGNGAVVRTNVKATDTSDQTSNGSALNITNLALNLPSLIQKGAQAPKIWIYPTSSTTNNTTTYTEDDKPTITLSGPLQLLNSDNEYPYDSLNLSSGITRVPFLYLCDNATKKITITDLDIQTINKSKHYGYQGVWSPYWEEYTTTANSASPETANTSHRILYVDWTPTGYIPNPKYKTPLIANALWGSVYTTLSGMHTLLSPEANPKYFELGGQGLIMTIRQRDRLGIRGFRMESAGYAATSSAATKINHKISFAFSQQISHIKEHTTSNKVSSKNYFGGIQLRFPWLGDALVSTASLAYNYGDHIAKHFYAEDNKDSEGYFSSYTFGACLNFMLNLNLMSNVFSVAPFIEALACRATLSNFIEQRDFARKFTVNRPLENITLPIGVIMQWAHDWIFPIIWHVQLAYHPVIYRHYPQVLTTLLSSNGSWLSSGTPIDRQSLSVHVNHSTRLFSNLKMTLSYRGDFASSTVCNYLKAECGLTF
ncbi:polymorphic outer membrane protein F family [Chlamydia felis Fe/C-56]|uniref:Polymorphic outer membrane protein F family n=4 Tax=Chlamydia felis TaxID=83556 RepID=Q253M9_CHLFF|nr:polymorphic outer membrane protein middle domain-containing protein [Chlamydia felis]ABO20807.1 Pmp18 [Chlamydia felis]ABO20813.1 Pmp18 [Chlamydia felis]ABO20819.1 Pmp18 [Chlamydia felis]BAE81509.1 polymorphic outer membrane protein F family [Chlamydia felis Fe/C-56]